jgi:hypothetical protein
VQRQNLKCNGSGVSAAIRLLGAIFSLQIPLQFRCSPGAAELATKHLKLRDYF